MPPSSGQVVSAFPATGKSHYARRRVGVVDSDSSGYSWQHLGPAGRERHPDWPGNYMEHIADRVAAGYTVLVSTHAEVRGALLAGGVPFTLVYPVPTARGEYRPRMQRRGSPDALIRRVVDELWDRALVDCANQTGCVHVVLRPGEYLSDVLGEADASRGA